MNRQTPLLPAFISSGRSVLPISKAPKGRIESSGKNKVSPAPSRSAVSALEKEIHERQSEAADPDKHHPGKSKDDDDRAREPTHAARTSHKASEKQPANDDADCDDKPTQHIDERIFLPNSGGH
ncbi:hypothetical protein LDO32_08550 [Luteimonas sp. Y-2-2-4F]|nr:hypothetical protein [Luteimonas sp. Y-2-2-4F]MCD9031771.1 hypothetical protein [Luteimonas sp. Y-2-2-4F]